MAMDRRIASPDLTTDPAARELLSFLDEITESLAIQDSTFYYDFPIFRDESNTLYRSKVLLATRSHGLFVLAPTTNIARSNSELLKIDKELTQLDSILFGKFLRSKTLRKGKRDIHLSVNTAIISIGTDRDATLPQTENHLLLGKGYLQEFIHVNQQTPLDDEQLADLVSLLEGTKAISRQDERETDNLEPTSKAMALAKIEEKIANFDIDQRHAAISIVKGPQRIRGIAGSGKTIVLAMRAAHLHLSQPESTLLLTFWTKSLYDLIKLLVTKFYRQFNDQDPNWDKVHILHAWGGRSTPGVYSNACFDNGTRAQTLREITPVNNRSKFEQACIDLLKSTRFQQKYDYILIDEGQDLPASFYQLCFQICRGNTYDRNIVWAYDELQTIMDVKPQDVSKTFGVDNSFQPLIDLDRASKELSEGLFSHDIVLKKSYRNPPEILMCAHAIGLGLYNQQPVQILDGTNHWRDLGYEITIGNCQSGESTEITRPPHNSPLNLSDFSPQDEIIKYSNFESFDAEIAWVISEIKSFLDEGIFPHDILIISLDDRNAKNYFSAIAEELSEINISINNLQNTSYTVPKFFIENHISVSTIYKAKGNEAAVVFVVGIDAISYSLDDRRSRNRIFTAFTRSRAWLRVSGMNTTEIFEEMQLAIDNFPVFSFVYPDPEQIETIQRDLSEKSIKIREMQQLMLELGLTEGDLESLKQSIHSSKLVKK